MAEHAVVTLSLFAAAILEFLERYWGDDEFSLTTLYVNSPGPGSTFQQWHRGACEQPGSCGGTQGDLRVDRQAGRQPASCYGGKENAGRMISSHSSIQPFIHSCVCA
jgi:hypothetical protein